MFEQLFNPNKPMPLPGAEPDFATQQSSLAQQKRMAEQLRKKADSAKPLEGQMVSGHYVAPHWSQYLLQGYDQYKAGKAEDEYAKSEGVLQQAAAKAREKWSGEAPSMGTEDQFLPGAAGSLENPNVPTPGTVLKGQDADTGAIFKQYLAGAAIPGNQEGAANYLKMALAQVDREDKQKEAIRKQAEDLARKAEHDKTLDAQKRYQQQMLESIANQRNTTNITVGAGHDTAAIRRAEIAAGVKSAGKESKAAQKLKEAQVSESGMADAIQSLSKATDDITTGFLAGTASNVIPGGSSLVNKFRDEKTKKAIQDTTYWTDEIRHGRFGSALTRTEKASAAQYLPSEYDDIPEITRKAKGIHEIMQRNNRRLRGLEPMPAELAEEGDEVATSSQGATPRESVGKIGGATATPVTKTIGGKTYIQRNGQWFEQ